MSLSFTRNENVPLRLRKKIGNLTKITPGKDFSAKIFEIEYQGQTGTHIDNKVYLYGMHEAATIRLLRQIVLMQKSQGLSPVYLDIGTNTGLHLSVIAPTADKAFGFEPWDTVRSKAQNNLDKNKLDNVTIFPFGLSNENTSLPFTPPISDNTGVGQFSDDKNHTAPMTLEVRKGDHVMKENKISPTLIKIDVEGFEKQVLGGLRNTLQKDKPAVIFEYSDKSRADLRAPEERVRLFGNDYEYFGLKRSREFPRLVSFKPEKKYENVLAVHKSQIPDLKKSKIL